MKNFLFKYILYPFTNNSYSLKKAAKHRELHLKILRFGYKKGREYGDMGMMSGEYNNWLDEFYEKTK